MSLRTVVFHEKPNLAFISISVVLSFFATRPTPSFIPIVLTLSTLLLYSRIFIPARNGFRNAVVLCTGVALGGCLSRLSVSLHALSTPGISLVVLFALSAITSALAVATVYLDTTLSKCTSSTWSQITLFPTLWATLWLGISYLSPVGRLSAWSPIEGTSSYDWLLQFSGPAGIDWVVAGWAVVFSQTIGMWFIGSDEEDPLLLQDDHTTQESSSLPRSKGILLLAGLLSVLTVPSFFIGNFPLPAHSVDTTPLSVGCVLPPFQRYKRHSLTLDHYIAETRKLTAYASVLLWPEGAVTFNTEDEKEQGFKKVRKALNSTRAYVGVSFEETFSDPDGTTRRSSSKRTGLAIISRSSSSPHLVYYKRHLVPIAESFSLSHSTLPPTIYTVDLPWPTYINKTDWAPGPNFTRPVPLTASICLDFSDPLPFSELNSRAALVLAPARTWDALIGYTMWKQAAQRARETGSIVLWCDGGDGGVSGVAGGGFDDFTQVGLGSWFRTIGLQYPFDDRRTAYAYIGNYAIFFFWALVFGSNLGNRLWLSSVDVETIKGWVQRGRGALRRGRRPVEEASLLD